MNKARNRSSAKERIIKAYLRLLTQGKHRKVTVSPELIPGFGSILKER